jgi:hypothetical protein
MAANETQISAFISLVTKEEMERYTRATGVRKNHLIEEALRHHLLALSELPADVVVHPRLVLSRKSGKAVVARLRAPAKPTAKLRALMARGND